MYYYYLFYCILFFYHVHCSVVDSDLNGNTFTCSIGLAQEGWTRYESKDVDYDSSMYVLPSPMCSVRVVSFILMVWCDVCLWWRNDCGCLSSHGV